MFIQVNKGERLLTLLKTQYHFVTSERIILRRRVRLIVSPRWATEYGKQVSRGLSKNLEIPADPTTHTRQAHRDERED